MRRINWKTISTLITMVAVAGCQENVSTSATSPSVAPAHLSLAPAGRPTLSLSADAAVANTETDFTVGPQGGVFRAGNTAVIFPAHSICDPATSSYGVSEWDKPCQGLTRSITIHAVVRTVNGRPAVDFSPSLRFVPSPSASKWVWMYMSVPSAIGASSLTSFNILYAPVMGGAAYDESLTDASLRTYVDTQSGMSMRRIKHFSGYLSSSGGECNPDDGDPDCIPGGK
jgi:hypothetical protein